VTAVLVRRSTASIIVWEDQPRLGIFETKHHFFAGVMYSYTYKELSCAHTEVCCFNKL